MKNIVFLFSLLLSISSFAQVSKTLIVEHYTNTLCGVCANRNPGFYNWLNNVTDVLHIAYHPSSPYANCAFSQLNPTENDDRAKYYGVFGSTPRLVLNGNPISPSSSYSDAGTFSPYQNDSSNFELELDTVSFNANNDSFTVSITIRSTANHAQNSISLFIAMTEHSVSYSAPNGENIHHDVFRKAFTPVNGLSISNAPTQPGDDETFTFSIGLEPEWNQQELEVIAILNDPQSKEVLQAAKTMQFKTTGNVGLEINKPKSIEVYPNPVSRFLTIKGFTKTQGFSLISMQGQTLAEGQISKPTLDLSAYDRGTYFLLIKNQNGESVFQEKLILY